jgi:mono/diheme cytochrome c family protein
MSSQDRRTSASRTVFRAVSIVAVVIVVGIVASASYVFYDVSMHAEDKGMPIGPVTAALIERGEYLTSAADCAACHNSPNGKPFAGGLPFTLPFGTIYSTNITADRETGIGARSDDDFVRALHRGIAPGGRYLYPAFPYTSFTAMSRDDALAIKAYLFSLPPQHVANKEDSLSFPFNQRWGMAFWNLAFLSDQRFAPDPAQSAAVNRGAYLATALGHCGECHTPRTIWPSRWKAAASSPARCWWAGAPITSLPTSALASAPSRMRGLQAFSLRPTRKIAVPPPDRWQKRWSTVCNI